MGPVVKVDPEALPAGLAQERFAVFSVGMGDAEQGLLDGRQNGAW